MIVESTRFGRLEVPEERLLHLVHGLLGFGDCTRFALHEIEGESRLAWLQSIDRPEIAFPVVDGGSFGADYPRPSALELARDAGLSAEDVAVLVVVAARRDGLVANLLAPIVIDVRNRKGAQAVLDPRSYSPTVRLEGSAPARPRIERAAVAAG
jgi:flagellar assembly factor FliW